MAPLVGRGDMDGGTIAALRRRGLASSMRAAAVVAAVPLVVPNSSGLRLREVTVRQTSIAGMYFSLVLRVRARLGGWECFLGICFFGLARLGYLSAGWA